jgi:hypothetical protein
MPAKQVKAYCVDIEDKPGSLHRFLSQSALSGADYVCFAAFSCGDNKGHVVVVPKDPKIFDSFAKEANIKTTPRAGFIITGKDRIAAAADAIKNLAQNDIRGIAGAAMVIEGRFQLLVVVDLKDAERAKKVL